MQRQSVYHEFCHHLKFLRAAWARIHNMASSSAIKPDAFATICGLADTGYKALLKRSRVVAAKFKAAFDAEDMALKREGAKRMNVFNRVVAEYSTVLESEVIPHEDFPDGYQVRSINPHVQFDAARFVARLTDATHEVVRYCG